MGEVQLERKREVRGEEIAEKLRHDLRKKIVVMQMKELKENGVCLVCQVWVHGCCFGS